MTRKETKRILIVDDFPIVRQGLRKLIEADPELSVCGEAASADEALEIVASEEPDAAIVDISIEGPRSGLELTRAIRKARPDTRVVVLSMHEDTVYAQRAYAAGATGYIMKSEPPENVIHAVRRILRGETYACQALTSRLVLNMVNPASKPTLAARVASLTDRELTVFELIGCGMTVREIASKLELNLKTVETYRANIKRKLGTGSAAALQRRAYEWFNSPTG